MKHLILFIVGSNRVQEYVERDIQEVQQINVVLKLHSYARIVPDKLEVKFKRLWKILNLKIVFFSTGTIYSRVLKFLQVIYQSCDCDLTQGFYDL